MNYKNRKYLPNNTSKITQKQAIILVFKGIFAYGQKQKP